MRALLVLALLLMAGCEGGGTRGAYVGGGLGANTSR
jgi:hypothetical protein